MRVVNVRNSSGYFLPSGGEQDKNLLKMYLNARVGFIPFKVNGCSLSHLLTLLCLLCGFADFINMQISLLTHMPFNLLIMTYCKP